MTGCSRNLTEDIHYHSISTPLNTEAAFPPHTQPYTFLSSIFFSKLALIRERNEKRWWKTQCEVLLLTSTHAIIVPCLNNEGSLWEAPLLVTFMVQFSLYQSFTPLATRHSQRRGWNMMKDWTGGIIVPFNSNKLINTQLRRKLTFSINSDSWAGPWNVRIYKVLTHIQQ